jgi:hypothetical protein
LDHVSYFASPDVVLPPAAVERLLNGPAQRAVPPGYTRHLDNHWDEEYWWYICVVPCMTIMGALILARVGPKLRDLRALDLADCMYPCGAQ